MLLSTSCRLANISVTIRHDGQDSLDTSVNANCILTKSLPKKKEEKRKTAINTPLYVKYKYKIRMSLGLFYIPINYYLHTF